MKLVTFLRIAALLVIAILPIQEAAAAQIVVMDLQVEGGLPARLAKALNPLMLTELSRREGMSVISQDDVRALLELEASKQNLGCNDTKCMNEIAGSLGAELMATCQLSRVGRSFVASMTLVSVEEAKVVRRSNGRAQGGEEAAADAIADAVQGLFRDGLPSELQGPAAMSRRGFQAAMAGFKRAVIDVSLDPRPTRKRIITDLVQTELDYDADPKIDALDLDIRRGIGLLQNLLLTSKDSKERDHYLLGIQHYRALAHDLGRVKEIRQRSRERGLVPSTRPLRFEEPEPVDWPDPKKMAGWERATNDARAVVGRGLVAIGKGQLEVFRREWLDDHASAAERALTDARQSAERYKERCELLPFFATPPSLYERAISTLEESKRALVYLRCFRKGEIYDDDQVWLERSGGRWRISSW